MLNEKADRSAVEEYLRAFAAGDWEGLASILADENFRRVGPYMDVVNTKEDYINNYLRKLIPTLINYEVRVDRVTECGSKRFLVEISESFDVNGVHMEYPQATIVEVNTAGKISGVNLFVKVPGMTPESFGLSPESSAN